MNPTAKLRWASRRSKQMIPVYPDRIGGPVHEATVVTRVLQQWWEAPWAQIRISRAGERAGEWRDVPEVNLDDKPPIPIVHEDKEELAKWGMGLENMLEHCVFCDAPTPYWHHGTNNPVCPDCAKSHTVSDLPK